MQIRSSDCRHAQGFTLIEVMIAMVIISISLTGMAVTMGSMLDNATVLRERTYASWIAQNRIVEMRLAGTVPETGTTTGEVEYANTFWEWRAEVSETGVENLFRIDVEVSFPGAEGSIRKVTGFVGEPIAPGQSNRAWMQLGTEDDAGEAGVRE